MYPSATWWVCPSGTERADALASPQTEHGFTRLADELLDALIRYPFTKRQYKVVLAVIRKTYGFQKQVDDLTAPQLAAMTGWTVRT